MPINQGSFFATKSDLESLLQAVESGGQLQFVESGLFDSPRVEPLRSLLFTSNLGQLSNGDHNNGPCYLVAESAISIAARPVTLRSGGTKYAVDQQQNPKTIAFRPGGKFGDNFLIAGQLGTISDDPGSLELFQLFRKEMRRQFANVKGFYVGKEAGKLLDKGYRLTVNAKSPTLYDLKR